jgi:hypothetical protein
MWHGGGLRVEREGWEVIIVGWEFGLPQEVARSKPLRSKTEKLLGFAFARVCMTLNAISLLHL